MPWKGFKVYWPSRAGHSLYLPGGYLDLNMAGIIGIRELKEFVSSDMAFIVKDTGPLTRVNYPKLYSLAHLLSFL